MKIIYIDSLSPIGHKNFNFSLLDILIELGHDIEVAFKKNYLNDYKNKNELSAIYEIPKNSFSSDILFVNKILHRINLYKKMMWVKNLINKEDYDLVFFSSIEIISFCLSNIGTGNRSVIIDHLIGDINKSKVKKFFWKHINKKNEVIVMENYIKDYLEKEIEIKNKIWVMPHPLPNIETEKYNNEDIEDKSKPIIFAPSNSNNESFIKYLINNSNKKNCDYKIIIKSNRQNYENENLYVYNNRISHEKYYQLMGKCEFVLLPYRNNYNYRVSGVFFEAVKFNKQIIIHTNNTLSYYKEEYPNCVNGFDEFSDFYKLVSELGESSHSNRTCKLRKTHSKFNIKKSLNIILKNGCV